jgi:hypothetical protein
MSHICLKKIIHNLWNFGNIGQILEALKNYGQLYSALQWNRIYTVFSSQRFLGIIVAARQAIKKLFENIKMFRKFRSFLMSIVFREKKIAKIRVLLKIDTFPAWILQSNLDYSL